jgi:hypothetical protein
MPSVLLRSAYIQPDEVYDLFLHSVASLTAAMRCNSSFPSKIEEKGLILSGYLLGKIFTEAPENYQEHYQKLLSGHGYIE